MKRKLLYFACAALLLGGCAEENQERVVIRSIEDCDGKSVSTLTGSVQDLLISQKCPNSPILRTDTAADMLTMIDNGKACAGLESSISWMLASSGYPNIVTVGEGISPKPIGFAFNKSKSALREDFNIFLEEMITSGKVDSLKQKWFEFEEDAKMPDPALSDGSGGTLHIAVSAIIPPFNYIRNGKVVGIESEIAARFALSRNMKWDFVDVNFSGLIAYLQSGKADIGCCIFCITEERKQSVDFSIPWMEEYSLLLVNKAYAPEELAGDDAEDDASFWAGIKNSFVKSVITEDRYMLLVEGLKSTVLISLLAAFFGTLLGIFLCYTSKRRNRLVAGISNVYIEFMRCMPQVVFLMIMFYVVFGNSDINGTWVAVISFSLCFAAYTSVIFRSAVESIDKGQNEAALSMGFGRLKAFWNIILPQTVQRALPVYKGEFIGLVKATSIVGYIAVFDLTKAGDIIRSRTYEALFPLVIITIVYFVVIWVLTWILKYAERKTQPTRKKFFK